MTSGPGATNAITGLATAFMDSTPVVVISGQVKSNLIGTDSFQETDMIGISRPIVKHSFLVQRAEDIPSIIKKAFHIATTGRPGPVLIDIPLITTSINLILIFLILKKLFFIIQGKYCFPQCSQKLLLEAKKPVIYSGGGVIQDNASATLIIDAPVTNTLMGLGIYPATDQKFLGMLGMHGTYEANMAMHDCDLN